MFSRIYFGKELNEVTQSDLQAFFTDERDERTNIEFKSYPQENVDQKVFREKENDILRTICGLLNTDGGLIIWGAPKEVEIEIDNGKKKKICKGELCPLNVDISKDKFMLRVTSGIIPVPNNIYFYKTQLQNSQYIYLIEVLKSDYPPHQFQNIYWMRLDGHTRSAPHHLIEAQFKQIKTPNLACYLSSSYRGSKHKDNFSFPFVLSLHNFSRFLFPINVQYSLILDYGDFVYVDELSAASMFKTFVLTGRSDVDIDAIKVLHYNKPHWKDFYLILPDIGNKTINFSIALFAMAENCPAKVSVYDLKYSSVNGNFPTLELAKSEENQYMFDVSDRFNQSDETIAKKSMTKIVNQLLVGSAVLQKFKNL